MHQLPKIPTLGIIGLRFHHSTSIMKVPSEMKPAASLTSLEKLLREKLSRRVFGERLPRGGGLFLLSRSTVVVVMKHCLVLVYYSLDVFMRCCTSLCIVRIQRPNQFGNSTNGCILSRGSLGFAWRIQQNGSLDWSKTDQSVKFPAGHTWLLEPGEDRALHLWPFCKRDPQQRHRKQARERIRAPTHPYTR